MDRRGANKDQVRALLERSYEDLRTSFRSSGRPVYRLRRPWIEPCILAESHTVNGMLQSLTLAYGSWVTDEPHIKVTTWRDLPGQSYVPDHPADLDSTAPEDVHVDIDGTEIPGALHRHPSGVWLLRVDLGSLHLLGSGRGPLGELSFEPLTDLAQVIAARRAYLASRFPEA
jgi:hypothetical protein